MLSFSFMGLGEHRENLERFLVPRITGVLSAGGPGGVGGGGVVEVVGVRDIGGVDFCCMLVCWVGCLVVW